MSKRFFLRIVCFISSALALLCSCSKKEQNNSESLNNLGNIEQIDKNQKNHTWYYFTDNSFEEVNLPQNAPKVLEKPWTEAVRISSAAVLPQQYEESFSKYGAYAVVNRLGLLGFTQDGAELFTDASIFNQNSADSLVFSGDSPVFYLYRSTFFNEDYSAPDAVQPSRPFLVQFDTKAKMFYPLVSYANMNLGDDEQITGFFWDGKKWACSAKKSTESKVEFKYFTWQPLVNLTDLSPALNRDSFLFNPSSEGEYRSLNNPKLFNEAPDILKELVSSIPEQFTFYITWKNNSGTSPVSYYQQGISDVPLNAYAFTAVQSGYVAALFADGTTYIKKSGEDKIKAFRLPLLPSGYTYGQSAIAGNTLYIAWEESSFYLTSRSGFLSVDLNQIFQ